MSNIASSIGLQAQPRSGELATSAMAAKAKAMVEARYVIAFNRPRNIEQARVDILAACRREEFAETARYKRPCGSKFVNGRWVEQFAIGFSIRFAEDAIKAMKNVNVESVTVYEDDDKRTLQISVTDLESNVTYGKEVTISKTVERKKPKEGQDVISKRKNSLNEDVYLVRATEDEISNKIASNESKVIRNFGLRLVPSDILEEASAAIDKTLSSGGSDPKVAAKKVFDAFASLNVGPLELEKYLGHPISTVSPKELLDLRAVYSAIKDGEASWSDYVAEREQRSKPNLDPAMPPPQAEPTMTEPLPKTEPARDQAPRKQSPKPAPSAQAAIDAAVAARIKTPQESLEVFLSNAGVSWPDFQGFLVSDGHYKDADSLPTIHDLPSSVCEAIIKNTAAMTKAVKLFGKQ